jgi:small subunit ribosomal protein S6
MQFDASPRTLRSLNSIMRGDPRVIRWTTLKLGEKLEDIVKEREVTVDRTGQRGTGPRNSLNFLGKGDREFELGAGFRDTTL